MHASSSGALADQDLRAGATDRSLEDFRQRCRSFLQQHAVDEPPTDHADPTGEVALSAARAFQRKVHDAGLAGLTYPVEFGGRGLSSDHDRVWREEATRFPLQTGRLAISHGMCLPVLAEFGTDQQKRLYLAKLISAEEVWCQMFSEPGAGSDVASLQTRAVKDGADWILNGQKVWTTLAHVCERGVVLARTDPSRPKHRGISMFIVDLSAPGVDVRPIHQLDGRRRFNEVYLTDVRVPEGNLIPPENDGWRLATAMLMYERVAIGSGQGGGIRAENATRLIEAARTVGVNDDPRIRQELAKLYIAETCQALIAQATRARLKAGLAPGPAGSVGKLVRSSIAASVRSLSLAIHGPASAAWPVDDPTGDRRSAEALGSLSASIAGGTDEVQKNIIGERVLGLPREPDVDRDVPFSKLALGPLRG